LTNGSGLHRCFSSLIAAIFRAAWGIIFFTLIIGGLAVYYSYYHLEMVTSRDVLVSSDDRLISLSR